METYIETTQRAATRWVKGLRSFTYVERPLKLQFLETRRIRNDFAPNQKILYNQMHLKATQLFKFFRRLGLRRFFTKAGEPEEEVTVLHAELVNTGTVSTGAVCIQKTA